MKLSKSNQFSGASTHDYCNKRSKIMLLHRIIIFFVSSISPNLCISVKLAQKRPFKTTLSKHGVFLGVGCFAKLDSPTFKFKN